MEKYCLKDIAADYTKIWEVIGPELLNVSIRRIRLNSCFYLIRKIDVYFFY